MANKIKPSAKRSKEVYSKKPLTAKRASTETKKRAQSPTFREDSLRDKKTARKLGSTSNKKKDLVEGQVKTSATMAEKAKYSKSTSRGKSVGGRGRAGGLGGSTGGKPGLGKNPLNM